MARMKRNKTEKGAISPKKKSKIKKIVISVIAIVLVLAIGCGIWYYFGHRSTEPVGVYSFYNLGMTEYWGDTKETYGSVSTDKIQTVYLSSTQTVTEIFVQPGDVVSKGDVLMSFDTTLNDIALERKRLEVEKEKLRLEDARDELKNIKNMKPMVIPDTKPDDKPVDVGRPINGPYEITSKKEMDGSVKEKSLICWIHQDTAISDALLEELAKTAAELQEANKPAPQPPDQEPGETTDPTGEPGETTDPTEETSAPTQPEETTPPSQPIEPDPVNSFYVVFKVSNGNTALGSTVTWQGMYISRNGNGFALKFFDASGIQDPLAEESHQPEGPSVDMNSGYTASQIAQLRAEKEREIKELEFSVKMAEANYKIMQCEVNDGNVYAEVDGTVVSVISPEEANQTMQPIMKVSGGGGFYIQGSVSELDKDNLKLGQEVTIMDWYTGMSLTGTVEKIGDYPSNNNFGFNGMDNPNVSYYPFTVFVDGSADLQEGAFVSMQYAPAEEAKSGIYLEKPFIRTENGKSYVYVRGEDGSLEKRFVTTGKSLWGSYIEILSGVTAEDYIAFPYGKNVKEGAPTKESDLSELYGY